MPNYPKLILKKDKDKALRRKHLWVFSGAVQKFDGHAMPGDIVEVRADNGEFLALAHYFDNSITAKILSFEEVEIDIHFWREKIIHSFNVRKALGFGEDLENACFRIVNGEGDGIPGLIADYYAGHVVFQAHNSGMYAIRHLLTGVFMEIFQDKLKAVYDKSSDTLPENIEGKDGFLWGNPDECVIKENGLSFGVDYVNGQKTGFFLDQRDNRQRVGEFARDKKVLNTFCYTGGFSVYALKNYAKEVHSLDVSRTALEAVERNLTRNLIDTTKHRAICEDAKRYLKNTNERYDMIILDPPAFAKHINQKSQAAKGYKFINLEALRILNSGGVLATFSCSQAVDRQLFKTIVTSAAIDSGRKVKIIGELGSAPDHPINIFHPESEYLKGLILYVE